MPTSLREIPSLSGSAKRFRKELVPFSLVPVELVIKFYPQIISERIQLDSLTIPPSKTPFVETLSTSNAPSYQLSVSYVRSTNGGKSLLAKGRTKAAQTYSAFFDEKGAMNQEAFERWVGDLVESSMDGKSA